MTLKVRAEKHRGKCNDRIDSVQLLDWSAQIGRARMRHADCLRVLIPGKLLSFSNLTQGIAVNGELVKDESHELLAPRQPSRLLNEFAESASRLSIQDRPARLAPSRLVFTDVTSRGFEGDRPGTEEALERSLYVGR